MFTLYTLNTKVYQTELKKYFQLNLEENNGTLRVFILFYFLIQDSKEAD